MLKRLFFVVLSALALAGCAATENGQAMMGAPGSPVIFSYDGRIYTAADFEARLKRDISEGLEGLLAQGQTREQIEQLAEETNVRGQVFDQMVQEALIMRFARQHGVGVNPAAVDEEVFLAAAPAEGSPFVITTPDRLRSVSNLLRLEVIARNTRTEMVRARQIIVADEAAADQLLADLKAGADFAALARERSLDGNSSEQGGDLGWIPRGNNPPEFDEVAFSAPLNTLTKATSQLGSHVIEVLERQESRAFDDFEHLRNSANAQTFYEESFLPWYEELRREAESSGELQFAPNFDPSTVPLPYPPGTP